MLDHIKALSNSVLGYRSRFLAMRENQWDLYRVSEAIKRDLGKEYRRDPEITVGRALHEQIEDLDWKLLGAPPGHATWRINVFYDVVGKLGLDKVRKMKVKDVLPKKYLSICHY
jgi:hypothetical protein